MTNVGPDEGCLEGAEAVGGEGRRGVGGGGGARAKRDFFVFFLFSVSIFPLG